VGPNKNPIMTISPHNTPTGRFRQLSPRDYSGYPQQREIISDLTAVEANAETQRAHHIAGQLTSWETNIHQRQGGAAGWLLLG
jgi:hypothetical protein